MANTDAPQFSPVPQQTSDSLARKQNIEAAINMIPNQNSNGIAIPKAQYAGYIREALSRFPNVDPKFFVSNLMAETDLTNPSIVSPSHDIGLGQFQPKTWAGIGEGDPTNPRDSIISSAKYIDSFNKFNIDPQDYKTLRVAYNAGPGNALKFVKAGGDPSVLSQTAQGNLSNYINQLNKQGINSGALMSSTPNTPRSIIEAIQSGGNATTYGDISSANALPSNQAAATNELDFYRQQMIKQEEENAMAAPQGGHIQSTPLGQLLRQIS